MPPPQPLNIERLLKALKTARRRGVRDSRLVDYAPDVIDVLYPYDSYPDLTIHQRAAAAERLIVAAIDDLGGQVRRLSAVLFGVDPGTAHLLLKQRREIAAGHVGVLPGTFERGWWERQLLSDLATKVFLLHQTRAENYLPATNST